MRTWFAVENSLVDRNDLTAYEKLCGMVLARYAGRSEFDHLLTTDIIAVKMGVPSHLALEALRGLVKKGLVDVDSTSDLFLDGSDNHIREIELEEFKDEKDTQIIRSNSSKYNPEPLLYEELEDHMLREDQPAETESETEKESIADFEDEKMDNLDKMLLESQIAERSAVTPSVDTSPKTVANKGYQAYANTGESQKSSVMPQNEDESDLKTQEADPELMKKSIHEQSDSVRAWIEESETMIPEAPPVSLTPTVNREALVTKVMNMIEEPINDRQARIILGLAEYDLEKVSKCYLAAQNTQVTDKIDMLIHELQKKDEFQPPQRVPKSSQVDFTKLNQMKKYQAMKKK